MPTPKSPLDKPSSSSHSRRPSLARRTSSEKSSKSSKHGSKSGHSSTKTKDSMSDAPTGAKAPVKQDQRTKDQADSAEQLGTARRSSQVELDLQDAGVGNSPGGNTHDERTGDPVPRDNSTAEVERLRAAMNAQLLLKSHRERLAQHINAGTAEGESPGITGSSTTRKARVSPIHEEVISPTPSFDGAFASPIPTGMDTASTESARTIRGGMTPSVVPRTPSYPFPSMRAPRQSSWTGHRPFTALSPTVNPANYAGGTFETGHYDQVTSGSITPASTMNFLPAGQSDSTENPIFETPNLYELSLRLTHEPGLDAWWTTVVQLMRDLYKAERITLAVPADSTDVENVPWGQKATYNAVEEDELSLAYLPRGSSMVPSSSNDTSNSSTNTDDPRLMSVQSLSAGRPGIISRHSFTAYEDTKRVAPSNLEPHRATASRPSPMTRAKSYLSPRPEAQPRISPQVNAELSSQALEEHEAFEEQKPRSAGWEDQQAASRDCRGRIFPVLQALDYEADALLDSGGVLRVLERGKVIALTRDYPYLEEIKEGSGSKQAAGLRQEAHDSTKKGKSPESTLRISNLIGGSRRPPRNPRSHPSERGKSLPVSASARPEDEDQPATPQYEEYEQAPPSPWSQSPAPSPAIRAETADNPFFAGTPVDEETFNPRANIADYSNPQPVEAIGIDRSWTVLHIPLIHPLLSKPVQSFRLDAAAIENRNATQAQPSGPRPSFEKTANPGKSASEKRTPIAILSILTPVIPYPSNLRHSLSHLAPHLATSFSLCRHYTNLETEIAGLSRKRPAIAGFGAVAASRRSGERQFNGAAFAYSPADENGPRMSTGDSVTSPSDYSGVSRSTAESPSQTPNMDISSLGFSKDNRPNTDSPGHNFGGEGYFGSKGRPPMGRVDTGSASSIIGARKSSKDTPNPSSKLPSRDTDTKVDNVVDRKANPIPGEQPTNEANTSASRQDRGSKSERASGETTERRETSPSRKNQDTISPRRQTFRTGSTHSVAGSEKQHTQLHSYGADYGATFQSLPTTSPASKAAADGKPLRRDSLTSSGDPPQHMLPPSDRLKGLMLDSLPAHVFVALPVTGEIVWVNNRYLNYRGQTVPDLYANPWGTIHPEEREEYLKAWSHAIRTGEQFSKQVRIKRFDGNYRWFYTRAVGHRDIRGVIVQWYGSHMDIHDQHIAEVKAARQEEIEASEAKHRQLANLIPQIIFAATEDEGVTFANEQWLSYTGQGFEESLGLGFMDFVHPEDLAKCSIPSQSATPVKPKKPAVVSRKASQTSSGGNSSNKSSNVSDTPTEATARAGQHPLSRHNSSSSGSFTDFPIADLTQLARSGIIKASTDSNGRLSYTTEIRLRSKTGEYRWHLVRCVEVDNISLGSGDGSWFGACTDINDHKLLETKLKDAMDSKTRFLSNMSHEIRTPLIGISGMVNFLQDTTLNDEQMDYANTIHASAKSLLNIINDILDLSKVDAGMMKLSYDWFHPRSLVEEVNEMVCTMAITKRLELNYIVDNDVPEMVKGDKFRIRQVLLNVVGNAIKFTTVGEVFSRCRVITRSPELEEDEVMLEFSVIDTGRGFTKQEAELIFKPFSQIDGSSTRQHGGSGLGLVISRTLVELHGGTMEGSAVPEKGSTFVFTAKFGLATSDDHPELPMTPLVKTPLLARSGSVDGGAYIRGQQVFNSPASAKRFAKDLVDTPMGESNPTSPTVVSSSSSTPSLRSIHSQATQRSSGSSIPQSYTHFGEAARSGSQDLSSMKFAIPDRLKSPPADKTTFGQVDDPSLLSAAPLSEMKSFRPPMYSILLICPQTHSREATTKHIENTLPKDIPHQITPLATVAEGQELFAGDDPVNFTHIVLNLGSAEEIVSVIQQIRSSKTKPPPSVVILSDPVERQEVMKLGASLDYEQLAKQNQVAFIYKPVKPSRFAVVFDPDKVRDLSTDRNRFSAQQQVASQKQNYLDVAKRLGNKGHKVLLVEDNLVNQKVLLKYLSKIGITVELALDGVECVEKLFVKPHSHYSLILVSVPGPFRNLLWHACFLYSLRSIAR